ncbi:nuclear transport factor 2 family protein [Nocardia implantans]|uniref:Nuclear transport factor 2 family protein n=1 Tax=Nocardia implantans TaxID=3108168 RepID=A0ABU6AX31_9NOCA|nr:MULTISPECIES: nuclear transport factor 2 family protein [unclassified Nocardia]MBF6193809.1 nuclear transport factor 2 family protein [Nocardia beijingensis]MEA3529455.1 nuclear transport factor 2 family protein [Nocardia sp. CDC192]MEB3512041.1 nuclear transport factor 2 family protein [Nocardia sp. CDC186]
MTAQLDPTVQEFVDALNANDQDRFYAVLTDDATMSDDGVERNLAQWTEAEIFDSNGRMRVESVGDNGTELVADYTNSRWGSMRTTWRFVLREGKVSRFETGQA